MRLDNYSKNKEKHVTVIHTDGRVSIIGVVVSVWTHGSAMGYKRSATDKNYVVVLFCKEVVVR